jgi:hypothetical protein
MYRLILIFRLTALFTHEIVVDRGEILYSDILLYSHDRYFIENEYSKTLNVCMTTECKF